ncbi:MAG TPA: hypothetical protein VJP02_05470 [Candidatus Sulfotelmatobacter sp.]|nr:hypothetical protein [Candidatus Sulfotelmatobacter sp.]
MGCRSQIISRAAIGIVLAMFSVALGASGQCPSGFRDLGEVTATAPHGRYQDVKVTRQLALPAGIQIDDSYNQLSIQAASDGGASDMSTRQIPPGFQLLPGGQGGGAWWSIDNPHLLEATAGDKHSDHLVFRIDLYANSGGRQPSAGTQNGSSTRPNVWVRVCLKERS